MFFYILCNCPDTGFDLRLLLVSIHELERSGYLLLLIHFQVSHMMCDCADEQAFRAKDIFGGRGQ